MESKAKMDPTDKKILEILKKMEGNLIEKLQI
jgi:hypothetical protein